MITELINAIAEGNLESAQAWLRENTEIDINSNGGEDLYNALSEAVRKGHYEVIKLLLEADIDPNGLRDRQTKLFNIAAEKGNFQIMDLLLQYGADVNLAPIGLMRDVGASLQFTDKNCTVLDYLKDVGFNINSIVRIDFFGQRSALSSFCEYVSFPEGISYLLGTFQDKIDASNEYIRADLMSIIDHKIDDIQPKFDQCSLGKISAYLIGINLLIGLELDVEEQEFVDELSEKLLNTITEYNLNPDKLKQDLQKGSRYLAAKEKPASDLKALLIENNITNLYHFDHFIEACAKAQKILPQNHQLHKALKTFEPLAHQSMQDLKIDFTNHFDQQILQELYQYKSISEMEQDSLISIFKEWFGNVYKLQENHPHLSQVVNEFSKFLDQWEFSAIEHFIKVKNVQFKTSLEGVIAFQEQGEAKDELVKVMEITPYLSHLKPELWHEMCEYIGNDIKERFSNAKLINSSSLQKLYGFSSESLVQEYDQALGVEESTTQETNILGKNAALDPNAMAIV